MIPILIYARALDKKTWESQTIEIKTLSGKYLSVPMQKCLHLSKICCMPSCDLNVHKRIQKSLGQNVILLK